MNILILNWRDPKHPNAGGAEKVTLEYAKGWIKAGHTVTWFSSLFSGAVKSEIFDDIQIIRGGSYAFGVQISAFKWYFFHKHPQFDLVVDQFHGIPFFTPLYVSAKKLGFIHEVAKEVWRLNTWPKPLNLIPSIVGSTLEPLIFKIFYRNEYFLTVSESTKQDLINWGINEKKVKIIYNGISVVDPGKTTSKEKTFTVLFLGALSKDKGIFDAIEVFKILSKKYKKWQFWVAGKADVGIEDEMINLVKKYNLEDKFKYWGYVSEKKKFELLKRAHLMINPSIREGWGLVNIEANAMSTPVVGYDVPGTRDSIKDKENGFLCEENTPENMSEIVIMLSDDNTKYKKLSLHAKEWANNFDWKKSIAKSLELIEEL